MKDKVARQDGAVWVLCDNGKAQVWPPYVADDHVSLGSYRLSILVKEITEQEEFSGYLALSRHHYKGRAVAGRTARLVVRSFDPLYPAVLGYIELATPFFVNKARSTIFDSRFRANGMAWDKWDKKSLARGIHSVVRIARCVIAPEFRGVGLGQVLVKHAMAFARDHWQMSGLKPSFLEISAEMLRFVPFAQRAGMTFIGETQGNLARVVKDMSYLLRVSRRVRAGTIVREDSCGIVDQQVSRMNQALRLMRRHEWTREQFIRELHRSATKPSFRSHKLFSGILSLPKPTYAAGLLPEAQRFLSKRVRELHISNGKQPSLPEIAPLKGAVRVQSLSITYESVVRRTKRTHDVEKAFGISPDSIEHKVVSDLNVEFGPGSIVLIVGSSGSGKTSLLRHLAESKGTRKRNVHWPHGSALAELTPLRSTRPLIDIIGVQDTDSALNLMGAVGLSDAYVYLKRFAELSNGQQYRAMLANAIASSANVWFADEFCANLDVVTANIVATGAQKLARRLGAALVVASSNPNPFVHALRPDIVIQLSSSNVHTVHDGAAFVAAIRSPIGTTVPRIEIRRSSFQRLAGGKKTIAFFPQDRILQPGLSKARCGKNAILVRVRPLETLYPNQIRLRHARLAGYKSVLALRRALKSASPMVVAELSAVTTSPN